ncbi:hypothetical protein CRYPD_753 [uncultured Candidatus Thioglobus sp.]|nr:hypothetical protein CRYPD_753 [uncultured Candidatus Thioglobus sp.]
MVEGRKLGKSRAMGWCVVGKNMGVYFQFININGNIRA